MAYLIFVTGVVICVYSLIAISKLPVTETEENRLSLEEPSPSQDIQFRQTLAEKSLGDFSEAGMLYQLQEQVERQLAEVNRQKELAAYLMMRVEKRVDPGPEAVKPELEVPDTDNNLSPEVLERMQLFNDVYTLSDQGVAMSEIAKRLQRGKGEVELILCLRN